jgi:hypothetical protein
MTTTRTAHDELPDLTPLDTATRTRGDRATSPAAQQLLTRILETPHVAPDHRPSQAAVTRRRWAVTGGIAAALTTVGVVLPAVTDDSGAAFASWTPTPAAVPPADAAAWRAECLAAGTDPRGPVTAALSERRGEFTFALLVTARAVGTCLRLDPPTTGQEERGVISWGPGGDLPAPAPGSATVRAGTTFRSDAGEFTSAYGRVGEQVVAVELTPDGGRPVTATLADGYFTAWWPGRAEEPVTVTLTRRDGTTRQL